MVRLLLPLRTISLLAPGRCMGSTWFRIIRNVGNADKSYNGTVKYQEKLPKFPVPPLVQTCEKYLQQYKLYVDPDEFERTKKMVEEFCQPGGTGKQLQEALLKRADSTENWLSDWWRMVYLQVRDPMVLTTSPCALFHRQEFSDISGQLEYAAKLIFKTVRLVSLLARHEFPPIKMGKQPICMDQFFLAFSFCRIPGKNVDTVLPCRVDLPDAPRHIVVIRNNHMFKFDVLEANKRQFDAASILKQLEYIVDQTRDQGPPIGLVTTLKREKWADLYVKMKEDETNARSLYDIQSSLFVFSLDQTDALEDAEERTFHEARWALCGGGSTKNTSNRWHDKMLQIFVGSAGESGAAADHSHSEGIVAQTVAEMAVQSNDTEERLNPNSARSNLLSPQKLEFVVNDDLTSALVEAGKDIDRILDCFATKEGVFSSFGKGFLKSYELAHDGFLQIAIQMTYWRLFNKFPRVFEAVSLQRFKLGRVENVRTVTSETTDFIKLFHDENVQSVDKIAMLHLAIKVHMKLIFEAQMGQGMERHLFGLQKISEEQDIDASEFYDDPSWKTSSYIDIRTTGLQGTAIRALYAPLIQKSSVFIWYNFTNDFIRFAITARQDKTVINVNEFLEGLFASMLDLKDLLECGLHTDGTI